mgnify:FL=1
MKMIMAILHKDDEVDTIEELNRNKFFVTKLSTTGGFLKNKNTTIMIVTEDKDVDRALEIIKENSGERKTLTYTNPGLISGKGSIHTVTSVPVNVQIGGSTVFVLNVEQFEKF